MSKLTSKITAVLTLLFIAAVAVLTLIRPSGSGELPQPTLSAVADGSYTSELSSCMTDNLAGRDLWTSANAKLAPQISERIVNGVYIADTMLLDADIAQRPAPSGSAEGINRFAEQYDGAVCFVAVPTSSGVYSDKLPEYLLVNTEEQQISQLYESLDTGIRHIDAFSILKTLSDNYIYYRNDTKWTGYGAYCVYRTVIQKLGFQAVAYDKYTIEHVSGDFRGNLYERSRYSGTKPDILDVYEYASGAKVLSCTATDNSGISRSCPLYDKSRLSSDDKYGMYLGSDAPVLRIATNVNTERRLLLIKDSYADCFVQFLTQHYSEITIVSPDKLTVPLSNLIDVSGYEQTLFLFGVEDLGSSGMFDLINE
ncbi:MAG: hypothetical protein IJM44_01180 [Ruminococcus sp.]|nr:hypothetical protein [Ruminococcus sp.]